MEIHFLHFVTVGFFLTLLYVLRFILDVKKKCADAPFVHFLPSLLFDYATGKISTNIPLSSVIFHRIIQAAKQHNKEGCFMSFFSRPVLFIYGQEAIKVFANVAIDKSPEYGIIEEGLGAGLATSNGNRWKTHRRLINPVFHMGMLQEKMHMFNEHGVALIRDMEKLVTKPWVDLSECLKKHYFNASSEFLLGLKETPENRERINRISEIVDKGGALTVQRLSYPWLYPRFLLPLFRTGRLYNQTVKESNDILNSGIHEMKTHVSSCKLTNEQFSKHFRKSLAYILLNQHLKDPSFTLKDIQDEVKTVMVGGYDTVSWSTVWCLFMLGLHPDIQEKAYEEIMSTTSYFISYEESRNLEYLNAIIMETLRIYPVIPLFARNLTQDVQFGKYKIHKDTTIAFLPYMSHRDPEIFPDPEKFEPERFLSGDLKKSSNFMPFAEGSRSCIGKNYGLLEMKIFLAHILRNFKIISLDKREDVCVAWVITLTPEKPLRMNIIPRHNSLL